MVISASFWYQWTTLLDPPAHRDFGGTLSIAIMRCRKITVAAINGHAVSNIDILSPNPSRLIQAGVGMTALHLPFDLRFVWAGAKLTFPFVRRGIVAEGIIVSI